MHLKDNVAVRQSKTIDGSHGSDMRLDDIVFGAGTNDSTKVSFKYDENNRLTGLDIQDMKTPKKVLIKDLDKPHPNTSVSQTNLIPAYPQSLQSKPLSSPNPNKDR
jgi:hypothetical protein